MLTELAALQNLAFCIACFTSVETRSNAAGSTASYSKIMINGLQIISPLLGNVFALSKCNNNSTCRLNTNCYDHPNPTTTTCMSPAAATRIPLLQRPPKIQTNDNINGINSQLDKKKNSNNIATVVDILRLMDSLQFPIPADVYASLLKECTDLRDAAGGAEVHAHINRTSARPGILILNRLLLMYISCGRLETARKLFDKMTIRDSISWVTMIAGHVDNSDAKEALHLFDQMLHRQQQHHKGLDFISFIIPCILRACIQIEDFELGKQIHGWVLKIGSRTSSRSSTTSSEHSFLPSLFVVFYGKFRCLDSARRVFDQLCHHNDTVMWTAMMVEYCQQDHFEEAIEVFKMMGRAGTKKNNFTFSSVLRACGRIRDGGWCGRQVHANAIKLGVIELDSFVQSSLVDMYGKSGLLKDARVVFERICDYEQQSNNVVCWNAMLNNYTQQGFYTEAIKLLYLMKAGGMQPSESMVKQLRMACSGG